MVSTTLMTAQDLWDMGDRGDNCELIRGELVELVPPNTTHGRIMVNITLLLGVFIKEHRLGTLYAGDVGFLLQLNPDTVLGPDLAFVVSDRVQTGEMVYFQGPPDLAIEIVSPSNSAREVERKTAIYLGSGTRSVWIINPQKRQVVVHSSDHDPQIFSDWETLTGGEVLPALSLQVSEIFDD